MMMVMGFPGVVGAAMVVMEVLLFIGGILL